MMDWEHQSAHSQARAEMWEQLPQNHHFSAILDFGCGYGQNAVSLAKRRKITCDRYYGIDFSEQLLQRFLKYKQVYNLFPQADFSLYCASIHSLPIPDNSVDFVISNSIFIHLQPSPIEQTLADIARVLKPGGILILEDSFQNSFHPASVWKLWRRKSHSSADPLFLGQSFSCKAIEQLLQSSQLAQKCPQYEIKPLKKASVAKFFKTMPNFLQEWLAQGYSVYGGLNLTSMEGFEPPTLRTGI